MTEGKTGISTGKQYVLAAVLALFAVLCASPAFILIIFGLPLAFGNILMVYVFVLAGYIALFKYLVAMVVKATVQQKNRPVRKSTFMVWRQRILCIILALFVLNLLWVCVLRRMYWNVYKAAAEGNIVYTRILCLLDGPNPTFGDGCGGTGSLLNYAARNGSFEVAQYLLDQGADINGGGQWETPVEVAAYFDQLEMVRYLIRRGASYSTAILFWQTKKTGGMTMDEVRLVLDELSLQGDKAELRERIMLRIEEWQESAGSPWADRADTQVIQYLQDYLQSHPDVASETAAFGRLLPYLIGRSESGTR